MSESGIITEGQDQNFYMEVVSDRPNVNSILASMRSMMLIQGTDSLFDALSIINEFEDTVRIDGTCIYI